MLNRVKTLYAAIIVCFVLAGYFITSDLLPRAAHLYHVDALRGLFVASPILYFLMAVIPLVFLIISIYRLFGKTPRISVFKLIGMVFVLAVIACGAFWVYWGPATFNGFLMLLPPVKYGTVIAANYYPLWLALFGLSMNLLLAIIWLIIVTLAVTGIGRKILNLNKVLDLTVISKLNEFLLSFAFGSFLTVFALFLLGILNLLNAYSAIILLCLFICLSFKEIVAFIKLFLEDHEIPMLAWPFLTLLLSFVGINLLELLRPIPIGWDDLNFYQNTAKLIADTGTISAGMPHPWELFMSLGYFVPNFFGAAGASGAMLLSFLGAIIGLFALFSLLRKLLPESGYIPFLLVTLFYTMPSVFFQSAIDTKIDLPLFGITACAILAYTLWKENKKTTFLFISTLLFGLTLSIKFTAAFAIVPFGIFILVYLYKLGQWRERIYTGVLCALLLILPITPWLMNNISSAEKLSTYSVFFGQSQSPNIFKGFDKAQININTLRGTEKADKNTTPLKAVPTAPLRQTSKYEELTQYIGYTKGIGKYLMLPISSTFNIQISGIFVDIGFVWLALILGLIPFIKFRSLSRAQVVTLWATVAYFALWMAFANGVIWYALPGFIGLCAILGMELKIIFENKAIRNISFFVIVTWLIITTCTRFYTFYNPYSLLFATRAQNAEESTKNLIQNYVNIVSRINATPATATDPAYVYKIGTSMQYFINDNPKRIFNDPQLDTFTWLYSERDREFTALRLKALGFKFLVVDLAAPSVDTTPEKSLTAKFNNMLNFAGLNDKLELVNPNPNLNYLIVNPNDRLLFVEL